MDKELAYRIYVGSCPTDTPLSELIQISIDNGDLWCLDCNNPNESCTCEIRDSEDLWLLFVTYYDSRLDDYLLDENSDRDYQTSKLDKTVLVESRPISTDELLFCEDCGRSFDVCDCHN